ncbi:MAG TPA: DUF4255 domain-containing protein [Actinoplanes sp.]|nr:DUF4255 domain-containing protein [Actinoplanes sp.]
MFHDLDDTLAALLERELTLANVAVSFAAPDDQFPPSHVTLPAIAFFLYDARENMELRSTQWELEPAAGGVLTRRPPPVRVDCSYLVTAWPSSSAPDPARDEHRLLGEVLKVLLRHRTLPADYLRGELAGQDPPVRAGILAQNQLHSLGEFWQAMGGKPKAALHYAVTISVDVHGPAEAGPPVTDHVIRIEQGSVRSA